MQFRFDPSQDFQLQAISSVVDLFEGQARVEKDLRFELGASFAAVPNRLDLDDVTLLKNLNVVQARNGIASDSSLEAIEERITGVSGEKQARFANFSVEMETGTGKTYVYVRTALELYRRYGMRKFVVVVPSVAIREGVLKTLQMTHNHLRGLYDNTPYRYYSYDSANLSQIRQFALSDAVEYMIMTIDSFNKASNVIRQSRDQLQGEMPIHLVQAARPVLILDEPQNMESELSIRSLANLDPLFALRYSATHRNPYNLVYRLTPFEAYRQGIVKRIEVAGVRKEDEANQAFIRLESIRTEKTRLTARLTLHKLMADGTVKEKTVTVRPEDDLEQITERSDYAGYRVDEISKSGGYVRFTNGVELRTGEAQGAEREAIFEAQIEDTIKEHFRKQQRLKEQGIKVLSLFFIDRVDNYQREDGIIRRLFNQSFERVKQVFPDWQDKTPDSVQAAYFAQKRRKGGEIEVLDTVSGRTREDEAAYDLIMKDKERLLSFEEPVSFIFSHSALREGWDNPNVFQICTLNQTASEMKKRQEVGRGVRLCVNQTGDRVRDEQVNVLTVIANESYERYVERLQSETADEYGRENLPPKPKNARDRGKATLRKNYLLKPEFKELWERIRHKTRYAVKIDSEKLTTAVVAELDKAEIRKPRITITKVELRMDKTEDVFTAVQMSGAKTVVDLAGRYPLPNLVEKMSELLEHLNPPIRLTRHTLLEIYKRTKQQQAGIDNPHEFATVAVRIIAEKLADMLVDGIQYEKMGEWYEMTQFEAEIDSWAEYLVPAERSLYDHVAWESEIERKFAEDLERDDRVKLYVKLPRWFTVQTPVGEYNPDWAIVMEPRDATGKPTGEQLLYLVRETKDKDWKTSLRPDERRKVDCGRVHFEQALGVSYEVVSDARELS
jgi:type III restriction enzyme